MKSFDLLLFTQTLKLAQDGCRLDLFYFYSSGRLGYSFPRTGSEYRRSFGSRKEYYFRYFSTRFEPSSITRQSRDTLKRPTGKRASEGNDRLARKGASISSFPLFPFFLNHLTDSAALTEQGSNRSRCHRSSCAHK